MWALRRPQKPAAAQVASHMFFARGKGWHRLIATHPPLEERIRRLNPINGTLPATDDPPRSQITEFQHSRMNVDTVRPLRRSTASLVTARLA
jgi:hypothetical protein